MGVKIREKVKGSGEWWIFIHYKGKRASKKVGTLKAARKSATDIEREITLERFNIDTDLEATFSLFRDYAEKWMEGHVRATLKESTYQGYRNILDNHLYPDFGKKHLSEISREEIKVLCYRKIESGLSRRSVSFIARTLSTIFNQAIEDGIVSANPAARPGRYIKAEDRLEKIDFLTSQEGQTFLEAAKEHTPRFYPLFLMALRTGMRQGEMIGLQWADIDWNGKFIEIRRSCWKKVISTPKSGKSRRVDMSDQLAAALLDHRRKLAAEALKERQPMAEWVFPSGAGTPLEPNRVREAFHFVLKKAGLRRVRFHDLRHTFASWLIANGESLVYVKEQLGHHSIQITVDTYGHLIPGANRRAVNALDDPDWERNPGKSSTQVQPGERKLFGDIPVHSHPADIIDN
jgi:integrase